MKTLTVSALVCALMALTGAMSPKVKSCPPKWTAYNGRCFGVVLTAMTWAKAERNCEKLGGNLASVHSADEYAAIQKIVLTVTKENKRAWIGGSDATEEGTWLWADGSFFNYQHCGKFDNYKGNQHCLQMNYGAKRCWDDITCSATRPSVCVRKMW